MITRPSVSERLKEKGLRMIPPPTIYSPVALIGLHNCMNSKKRYSSRPGVLGASIFRSQERKREGDRYHACSIPGRKISTITMCCLFYFQSGDMRVGISVRYDSCDHVRGGRYVVLAFTCGTFSSTDLWNSHARGYSPSLSLSFLEFSPPSLPPSPPCSLLPSPPHTR